MLKNRLRFVKSPAAGLGAFGETALLAGNVGFVLLRYFRRLSSAASRS
jgi:hypothetical protein